MQSRPATFTVLLLLLSCMCCIQQGHSVGRTYPAGPIYVLVNDTIDIICVIDLNPADGLNSSALNWYTNKLVDQRYVRILNESAIQLRIPNAQPSDENYVCKLKLPNQTYNGISYNEVRVGYRPSHVQNFTCLSHNWTNMTCTFEKPANKVDSKYSLHFRVDRRDQAYECTLKAEYNRMYRCTLTTDSKGGIYRQTYPYYYFTLRASNPLGSFEEELIVNHYDSGEFSLSSLKVVFCVCERVLMVCFSPVSYSRIAFRPERDGRRNEFRFAEVAYTARDAVIPQRYGPSISCWFQV